MIYPKKSFWAKKVFDKYLQRLLENNFSHFYLVNSIPEIDDKNSLLIVPNHFSWWDGFFIYYLSQGRFRKRFYLMMLEEQLKRYWFFAKVGAFSINPANPISVALSVKYTSSLLNNAKNLVVLYPQGKIEPYDKRPLEIHAGYRRLLQGVENCSVLPVVFKIVWHNAMRPDIFCAFGNVLEGKLLVGNQVDIATEIHSALDLLDRNSIEGTYQMDLFEYVQ